MWDITKHERDFLLEHNVSLGESDEISSSKRLKTPGSICRIQPAATPQITLPYFFSECSYVWREIGHFQADGVQDFYSILSMLGMSLGHHLLVVKAIPFGLVAEVAETCDFV